MPGAAFIGLSPLSLIVGWSAATPRCDARGSGEAEERGENATAGLNVGTKRIKTKKNHMVYRRTSSVDISTTGVQPKCDLLRPKEEQYPVFSLGQSNIDI